jgi:hypothetical protein
MDQQASFPVPSAGESSPPPTHMLLTSDARSRRTPKSVPASAPEKIFPRRTPSCWKTEFQGGNCYSCCFAHFQSQFFKMLLEQVVSGSDW